ncbi:hypothetical protein [Brevundimonas aurifodinae]|uniref:Bulb-type lectin domain-containing protein n=1 Tax=Brevundimonas aurifodinae TaxID=1508312 RepID=A0ABV1NMK4_9CAUL
MAITGESVFARGVAPGPAESFYVVGSFGAGRALTIGSESRQSSGGDDLFVARVSSSGDLIWFKTFGGSGGDFAFDVDSDGAGNAYVTGRAVGRVAFGGQTIDAGDGDAVLFKLSGSGDVVWVRQTAGPGGSAGNEVATDAAGNSAIVGPQSGPLSIGSGVTVTGPASGTDPFVAYFRSDGTPVWGARLAGQDPGSSETEAARGVAIAPDGRTMITGPFSGSLSIAGLTGFGVTSVGDLSDCYVLIIYPDGQPAALRRYGGPGQDVCRGIDGASDGGARLSGTFDVSIFEGTNQLVSAGESDLFVAALASGGEVLWARGIGSPGDEQGSELEIGPGDRTFLFGNTTGMAAITGGPLIMSGGLRDQVVISFTANGGFDSVSQARGTGDDIAFALALLPSGMVGVAGTIGGGPAETATTDFGATRLTTSGLQSFFAVLQPIPRG